MNKMNQNNTTTMNEGGVIAQRMTLKIADVPQYFDRESLCSTDIVAYVRSKDRFPDPRVPVILDADCAPFDKETLSGNKIFWGGADGNENEVSVFSGLSDNVYLPIYTTEFDLSQEDYGIIELGASFGAKYGLKSYTVLLCGPCTDAKDDPLTCAWEYVCYNYNGPVKFDTTVAAAVKQRRLSDGIDISDYVKKLRTLKSTNDLNHVTLMKVVDEIGERIKEMQARGINPRLQCLMSGHPEDVQLLLLYLPLKFNLSPLYVEAYLQNYVDHRFNYDYEKLSLYERFMWMRGLPEEFGYLGRNVRFFCFCDLVDEGLFIVPRQPDNEETLMTNHFGRRMSKTSAKRIYPKPLYAAYVNTGLGETIMFKPDEILARLSDTVAIGEGFAEPVPPVLQKLAPHLKLFEMLNYGDVAPLIDFRASFKGSTQTFTDEDISGRNGKAVAKTGPGADADLDANRQWLGVFVSMAEQVKAQYNEEIFPTVKNCVLYQLSANELLLLYCPGSLGVTCKFTSEYFDKDIQIIGEEDFHRFVDMRTLLALIEKTPLQDEASFQEGNKRFAEIMTLEYRNLEPALDYDLMLAVNLLQPRNNGLSYFDKMLRSTKNIMPIVTDEDNPLYKPSELLRHFSYLNLLSADTSNMPLTTITCFGTLEDVTNDVPILQTTIETYRGCQLL